MSEQRVSLHLVVDSAAASGLYQQAPVLLMELCQQVEQRAAQPTLTLVPADRIRSDDWLPAA